MASGKQQDGYVIVVVAGLLVVLLGFAALAVDVGVLYGARTGMQRAADAAALAGAYTFISEPTSAQPATASDRAMKTAVQNTVLGNYIQTSEVTVAVDTTLRRVTVDIAHNENTYFAKAISWTLAAINVEAIAEASPTATASYCEKPWFIPNSILSNLDPCAAQNATPPELMIDTSTTPYSVTAWAKNLVTLGHQFTVKPGNPGNAAGPGQFYAIRLGDSTGGNDYRTNIGTCTPEAAICGHTYGVEPGNMIGPTKQGVSDLVTIFGTVSPDTYLSINRYGYPGGGSGPTSHQLVVAPIWDVGDPTYFDCTVGSKTYDTLKGGATIVIKVVGFATLFIEGMGGGGFTCEPYVLSCGPNDVIARVVGLSACGSGGINPDESGPFALPLRLIRTD